MENKTEKLFRIFEWHDINNGIGRGKTKTYLMAETKKEAVLKFGEANDIKTPWVEYGADERTMKEFEQELKEMYKEMAEINDLYEDLVYIYNHEIEND